MKDAPPHPTLAFQVLSNLHAHDYDLLATEINNYAYAIRTRTGRTTFTAKELRVLFNRMLDIMVLKPEIVNELDQLTTFESAEQ